MEKQREFSNFENAHAILNGIEDCVDEFVDAFVDIHKQPLDNAYKYDWLLRSLVDVSKINHSVLYVACGTAGYTRLFNNIKRFVGIDFSKKMIEAAKKLNINPAISFDFHCTTFENFVSDELFDIIWLGPYGHYVPYSYSVLEKSKKFLKNDGFLFCTITDPDFSGSYSRFKELLKQLICNRNIKYDSVKNLEKMLKKSGLEVFIKLRMKTDLGHSFCYIVKSV